MSMTEQAFAKWPAAFPWVGTAVLVGCIVMVTQGDAASLSVAEAVSCLVTMVGGIGLFLRGRNTDRAPIRFLGPALALCGIIQVTRPLALDLPDWLGLGGTNLFYLVLVAAVTRGVLAYPELRPDRLELSRGVLDSVLVGSLLALALWRWVPHTDAVPAPTAVAVLSNAIALGFCSLLITRGATGPVRLAGIGLVVALVADEIVLLYSNVEPVALVLVGVRCVGMTIIIAQLEPSNIATDRRSLLRVAEQESRHLMVFGTLTALLVAVDVANLAVDPALDGLSWMLAGTFALTIWGREVVRSKQNLQHSRALVAQAVEDPLTRLGNRRMLHNLLEDHIPTSSQEVAAITIDLDGFKETNDLLGHAVGDHVLAVVGQAMLATVRGKQTRAFRMGGDEFLVLTYQTHEEAAQLAHDLFDAVGCAVRADASLSRVVLTASVGVKHGVVTPERRHEDVAELLRLSGDAMRAAKRSGKGRVLFHDDAMARDQVRAMLIESRLRRLLASEQCVDVQYQPLMNVQTGQVAGVEALARWTDDELGPVCPDEFISVAEDTGLIVELGGRILDRALSDLGVIGFLDGERHVAVNVSPIQLRAPGFADAVVARLKTLGISPGSLVLEVTESVSVSADTAAGDALRALADAGVGLAIDDFGAGYASIGYLQRLPVTVVKLDRSLTSSLHDPRTDAIVRGVVAMATRLELDIVLEGVETPEQAFSAADMGIGYTQGWLYAPAVKFYELNDLILRLSGHHAMA